MATRRNIGNSFWLYGFGAFDISPSNVSGIHHQFGFRIARRDRASYRFSPRRVEVGFGVGFSCPTFDFSHFNLCR
jgi:hypothetical protein